MKYTRADWMLLAWPLIILLGAMIAGGVVVSASQRYNERLERQFSAAQRQLGQARMELVRVRQQEENFRGFAATYNALADRGLVGGERRLDWIDLLKRLRERHSLSALDYEVSAQQAFASSVAANPLTIAPRTSTVDISATALHEGDLLAFLTDFQRETPGVFRVRRCDMTRLNIAADDVTQARVSARCAYEWITLKTVQ